MKGEDDRLDICLLKSDTIMMPLPFKKSYDTSSWLDTLKHKNTKSGNTPL